MVLQVPHEKSKQLAEAVANKDAESLGFYRHLVENNGKLIWQKSTVIPERTIERELLHAADCMEVKRVRYRFDASHLPILKVIENKEGAVNELAQLITEVNGGIIARGDSLGNRNLMRKKKFHHAKAYEAITAIYFPQSETLEEKKQDLSPFSTTCPYRIIPKLYDPTGFKEEMSIDNLPTDKLLAAENDVEQKMREGQLYARAILRPNQYIEPKVSKRTGKPKPPETRFSFEARKISRTPEGDTGKDGFGLRSVSKIGYTAQMFGRVGLLYGTKLKDVIDINTHNINSGFGKKAEYKSRLEEKKLDPAHLEKKHQDLIWYVKTGCTREQQKSESAHTEVILTAKLADAKAIYFTGDHIKGEPAFHPYARILLAIYVQKLCEKSGKVLPIVEYSNAPSLLRKMSFTDEQILSMWKALASNYFLRFRNKKNDKHAKERIFSMSSEELERRCLYVGEEKGNFEDPDKYYDEALRIKVRTMLSDLREQLLGEKVGISSSVQFAVFTQKTVDHIPTQSSNDSTLSP